MGNRAFWGGMRRHLLGLARTIEQSPEGDEPFWRELHGHLCAIARLIDGRFG